MNGKRYAWAFPKATTVEAHLALRDEYGGTYKGRRFSVLLRKDGLFEGRVPSIGWSKKADTCAEACAAVFRRINAL